MEMIVVRGVHPLVAEVSYVIEISVMLPCHDSLVMHRIREGICLEDTRSGFCDAVPACLDAVLDLHLAVGCSNQFRQTLLDVVCLALSSGERGVPCVVGCNRYICRVLYI